MTKTLIVPDIHCEWEKAEKIMTKIDADVIVQLGDTFDSVDDNPELVKETAEWFVYSVNQPNRIHLMGNHSQNYAFNYSCLRCSGYAQWKYFIIHELVPKDAWDKVKWYYWLDNKWLLTHAGLHKTNIPPSISELRTNRPKYIKEISNYLDHHTQEGIRLAASGQSSWILNAGYARYGSQKVGGITWCDHRQEFQPSKGLWQIYGHTPQRGEPSWWVEKANKLDLISSSKFQFSIDKVSISSDDSYNLCLDVSGNLHYAVWDGKSLVIGSYKDL